MEKNQILLIAIAIILAFLVVAAAGIYWFSTSDISKNIAQSVNAGKKQAELLPKMEAQLKETDDLLDLAQKGASQEVDSWVAENIQEPDEGGYKKSVESNKICGDASELYAENAADFENAENIPEITAAENRYFDIYDYNFNPNYSLSFYSRVTNISTAGKVIQNATAASENLELLDKEIKEILLLTKNAPDSDAEGLNDWYLKMNECYSKRSEMAGLYLLVIQNNMKYAKYFQSIESFYASDDTRYETEKKMIEFEQSANYKQALKLALENKTNISNMRGLLEQARQNVDFGFIKRYILWTIQYDEYLDTTISYYKSFE